MGKPVRVALKLDQDNFNKNTLFLKFDEIKNTYNIIKQIIYEKYLKYYFKYYSSNFYIAKLIYFNTIVWN